MGYLSDRLGKRWHFQMLAAILYIIAGIVLYFTRHFYELLIFGSIDGVASGAVYTILFLAIGDVFSEDLLAYKVGIINFFSSLSATIGPICAERLFDFEGNARLVALFFILLGILEVILLSTVFGDSLSIRAKHLHTDTTSPPPLTSFSKETSSTSNTSKDIPIWRLAFSIPVILSTLAIITTTGIESILELFVPLHLDHYFGKGNLSDITYAAYGSSVTLLSPLVGWLIRWLIDRYGEYMRYYLMGFGSILTILSMVWLGFSGAYSTLLVGYIFYPIPYLLMLIPAQSAYGDLINNTGAQSMAQSYAIASASIDIGMLVPPPITATIFSEMEFAKPLIRISALSAGTCMISFLAYGIVLHRR